MNDRRASAEILADLTTLFLFANISLPALDAQTHFTADCRYLTYPAGSVMQSAEEPLHGIAVLTDGTAVICSDASSKAVRLRPLKKGDMFGAATLYCDSGGYGTMIRAVGDCTVLFLPEPCVKRIIAENSTAAVNYIRYLTERICFLNRKITAFTAGESYAQLAAVLLDQPMTEDGIIQLRSGMSEMARSLNMSRASLYRAWDVLTALGILTRDGSTVRILDPAALQNILL